MIKDYINKILCGNVFDEIKKIPDNSVNCIVTSPPYWGLRDYDTAKWEGGYESCDHKYQKGGRNPKTSGLQLRNKGTLFSKYENICKKCGAIRIDDQIGLEETPELYVEKLVKVFGECKRILKDDGTLWLNLGDTYSSHKDCKSNSDNLRKNTNSEKANIIDKGLSCSRNTKILKSIGLKNKDLVGIPWKVAFALQLDGWYLRQDIIWNKKNCMPESVLDRCTKSHEYIFLLSKSEKYYFDNEAIKEDCANSSIDHGQYDWHGEMIYDKYGKESFRNQPDQTNKMGDRWCPEKRNKRSVWTISTIPYKEAHFAVFPQKLIEPCIKAGCPEKGIVLDPFMGSGTTAIESLSQNKNFIGIELNTKYVEIAYDRIIKSELLNFNDNKDILKNNKNLKNRTIKKSLF